VRARDAPQPQAPDDPVPLDRVELLSRVDLGALGRSTVDGAGVGVGGPLGKGAGHGPPGPPPITSDLRVLEQVHPRFPPKARKYGEEARCDLMFTVTEDGLPVGIVVSGCPEIFRASVEEAAMQWRFSPPLIRGEPSPARFQIRVRFVLR
jgi:TonB family protein